jgi:P-type Cu+ transporter
MVYCIINQNDLCEYYDIEKSPGISQRIKVREGKFAFLDDAEVATKLVHFEHAKQKHITFYLPQVHCSSCIWLLEHLPKLNKAIISSQVNFLRKEVTIVFKSEEVTVRQLAELLAVIGYEPHISLHDFTGKRTKIYDKTRLYKLGIAGFCFGNIMLLSFPEYFSSDDFENTVFRQWFSYLNLTLSLPVFFYCGAEFFVSAWKSLRQRFLNIDAPIALAILITFGRSLFEIITESGAGYLDSMSGIVFFMLVGRFLQNKTYENLSFERDYTSYFPLGVTVIKSDGQKDHVSVSRLRRGDRIRIHSHEIVPADGILFMGRASIDYSFVTGESVPVEKAIGEIIYAGGKQTGGALEMEVIKEVSQSYLTQLWNNESFNDKKTKKEVSFVHRVSRYFTYILFSIALSSAIYWSFIEPLRVWNSVTAILIVACPCALLLSATFTNGNMLSILQRHGLFVKNSDVLESISEADTIVFDKTGTISEQKEATISYEGKTLNAYQQQLLRSIVTQSNHPLSRAIVSHLPLYPPLIVRDYYESKGEGSCGYVLGEKVKIGSATFVHANSNDSSTGSRVYISINDVIIGCYVIRTNYRDGLKNLVKDMQKKYQLSVVSGDNNAEEANLKNIFGTTAEFKFEQSPQQKLDYIRRLRDQGRRVIMVGDGLNDAGALRESNAGIAISDDTNNFSPGCDAIMAGRSFKKLRLLLDFCSREKTIIYGSFVLSILYNVVGLSFAVQGTLSPFIAAILMPVSSVSIMLYTTLMSKWFARKLGPPVFSGRNPL